MSDDDQVRGDPAEFPVPANQMVPLTAEIAGDDFAVARDLLEQLQRRSLKGLATWLIGTTEGNWETEADHVEAMAKQIEASRRDSDASLGTLVPDYAAMIEQICNSLKLSLRGGVASGVVYQPSDVPAQMPVPGTNASVIVIPEHSMMLCHYVCKALSWAFPVDLEGEQYAVSHKAKRILKKFRRDKRVAAYLARTVAYCATHDVHCLEGLRFEPLDGAPKVIATYLLIATEIFVLAHEYGHHIDEHQLGEFADVDGLVGDLPYAQELRADYLAALITAHFGATCTPRNPWAASAAAAIIGLGAMDLVFRTRRFLETGLDREYISDTHPPMMVRMIGVERLNRRCDRREREKMRTIRKNTRRVMTGLWDVIKPELQQLWRRGIRSMPLAAKDAQWLPR